MEKSFSPMSSLFSEGDGRMSVELPEALILAEQMNEELKGKRVAACQLRDTDRMQRIGFINKDLTDFDRLVGGGIESAVSRGNTILVKLDNGMNLIITPEYGGRIFYHSDADAAPEKYHLRVDFTDGATLTVRLTSMGVIRAAGDSELGESYVYRRDFSEKASPIEEAFTAEEFSELISGRNRQLKQVLVGKDAVLVGLSNSAFQDVIYRAGLHPKRKASELSSDERRSLYDAIRLVMEERIRLGGKDRFQDFHGRRGGYTPAMGPNMKGHDCPACGTPIERISHGGGQVYLCPSCQK
jgi:formamidopyrimidine-DNA glycosylase